MKKLLILILIALLFALSIYVVVYGVQIANFEVLGIQGIQKKNNDLEAKIQQATKLASTDYKKAVSEVEENTKKLVQEKQNYEDMTAVSSEGEIQLASQLQNYEIEYLWTKLGNHATSEGTIIKMDVKKGTNTIQNTYNLQFTATGTYISITDFISDIENDSSLGFKIEEFKMLPASEGSLQATFVCKDITIKDVSATTPEPAERENGNTANETNNSKTSNKANTTNAANTTNTNTQEM